jgi:hypothetical protein
MQSSTVNPCRLCGSLKTLRLSHIFPKFYWDWLKRSGSGYFREPEKPNVKIQDGYKRYMLCQDCETRFSAWETQTAQHVFKPVVADPCKSVAYGAWFYRFLISVLWRNLAIDLDERPDVIHPAFRNVEEAWRLFLLDLQPLSSFSRLHVLVADIPVLGSPPQSVYLTRDMDFCAATIGFGSTPSGVFAKFANFLVWAEVVPKEPSEWINTLVADGPGTLLCGAQEIRDGYFGEFLLDRGERRRRAKQELFERMSTTQREKLKQWKIENADRMANSGLSKAMHADFTLSLLSPSEKIVSKTGRNAACPCGSNKKYKKCHGSNLLL